MDSICGGGEHWAKPKENQRKETVIDFHLYVGHREPIKYEILGVAAHCVATVGNAQNRILKKAAPLLECFIAQ